MTVVTGQLPMQSRPRDRRMRRRHRGTTTGLGTLYPPTELIQTIVLVLQESASDVQAPENIRVEPVVSSFRARKDIR